MIIKQIKYYDELDKRMLNNPIDITAEKLVNGYYFESIICDEISIVGYPGTVLYINDEEIVLGDIGIYNIPIRENVQITSLKVAKDSMDFIQKHSYASLTITFIIND